MTIIGHLTKNVLTEINNKEVFDREIETDVDSDDGNEDNESDCDFESDSDPTDKIEKLITKIVLKDEDRAHDKSFPKIQFLSILDKYFKSYGNINAI